MLDLSSHRLLVTVASVLGATVVFLLLRDRSDHGAARRPPLTIWSVSAYLIATEFIDAWIAPFVQPHSWLLQNTYGLGWVLMAAYPLIPVMLFLYLTNTRLTHVGLDIQCVSSQNILCGVKWGACALCVLMIYCSLDPESTRLGFEKYRVAPENQINQGVSDMAMELVKMVIAMSVVSLAEEIIYRGLFYNTLRRRMAPWLATIISAWCFMVPHGAVSVPIFAMACGNAILFERYGSLGPAVLLHAIWDIGVQITIWFVITLQVNARTVFGIGFLVTFLIWCWAWAMLRISNMKRPLLPDGAGK